MSVRVSLHPIADGGNPRTAAAISRIGPDAFSIAPLSEDNDPNYKFRCEVRAENHSGQSRTIRLHIDWGDRVFNRYRHRLYLKNEKAPEWLAVPMQPDGETASGQVVLDPGRTTIAAQPAYNWHDNERLFRQLAKQPGLATESIGYTREGRPIRQVILDGPRQAGKQRTLALVCRIHPYETAGSYCAEGIVEAATRRADFMRNELDGWRVHLIPMANPDGVYNGLCKRTAHDGVDLSKQIDPTDQTCKALLAFLDEIRPEIYCEIHNWMLPDVDGIYFLNRFKAHRLIRRLPKACFKPWKIELHKKIFAGRPEGLKRYCRQKFNSTAFVLEFPWFGRNAADMKAIGLLALNALKHL